MVSSNLKIFHSSLSPLHSFYPPDAISRKKQKKGNGDDFLSFLNNSQFVFCLQIIRIRIEMLLPTPTLAVQEQRNINSPILHSQKPNNTKKP